MILYYMYNITHKNMLTLFRQLLSGISRNSCLSFIFFIHTELFLIALCEFGFISIFATFLLTFLFFYIRVAF